MTSNYINEGFKVINNLGEEEIIQIPYNLNNVFVTEIDIINLLDQFNVKVDKINNIQLFRESFTHKSYCNKSIYPIEILEESKKEINNKNLIELQENSYERLEFFGDRVLKLIVSMYLFYRYPNENEGFMTRLQTKIEDKKNLPIMSKELGLGKFFLISKSIENMKGRDLDKIHEDVFESFIGALFLSNGFEPCCLLITNLLETLIDYSDKLYCDNNYKDILLKYHHINVWEHPKYDIIYTEGPPHKRRYIVGVQKINDINTNNIEDKYIGYGIGNSHKEGAQNSAKMALIIYGVLKEDQYVQNDIFYPDWNKINNNISIFDNKVCDLEINDLKFNNLKIDDNDNDSVISEKSL